MQLGKLLLKELFLFYYVNQLCILFFLDHFYLGWGLEEIYKGVFLNKETL